METYELMGLLNALAIKGDFKRHQVALAVKRRFKLFYDM